MAPELAQPRRTFAARTLAWPFLVAIRLYRVTLSPFLGGQCRFHPTCSQYGLEAFGSLPVHRAAWLTGRRILRCHPWGGSGYDPVPVAGGASATVPGPPGGPRGLPETSGRGTGRETGH